MVFEKTGNKHDYNIGITILLLFFIHASFAQKHIDLQEVKKKFEGEWINAKTKRHLSISFEKGFDYATINNWIEQFNSGDVDAYKAFIKNGKLIIYAENDDHHAPYCEMEIVHQKLIFQCNSALNFKDQFLKWKTPIDKTLFERKIKKKNF